MNRYLSVWQTVGLYLSQTKSSKYQPFTNTGPS